MLPLLKKIFGRKSQYDKDTEEVAKSLDLGMETLLEEPSPSKDPLTQFASHPCPDCGNYAPTFSLLASVGAARYIECCGKTTKVKEGTDPTW